MLNRLHLFILIGLLSFTAMPVLGVETSLDGETRRRGEGETALAEKSPSPPIPQSPSQPSVVNLLAQGNLTRVTGVEVNQTESGLELILKTSAGSERLVPLILPEGNDLVIDILDATLAFSIRNGVTETNPAPGIREITVNKGDENSIRVRIAGANQTPNAEIVPGREDLVLSVTPKDTTADEPFEVRFFEEVRENSFGIYLQDQIAILDNLQLVVGGRFDTYNSETTDFSADGEISETEADAFSPRVGIVYQPIEPVSLYASYTRSFTPVSGSDINDEPFEPQRGTGFEIGVKSEIIKNKLSSTLALYDRR